MGSDNHDHPPMDVRGVKWFSYLFGLIVLCTIAVTVYQKTGKG